MTAYRFRWLLFAVLGLVIIFPHRLCAQTTDRPSPEPATPQAAPGSANTSGTNGPQQSASQSPKEKADEQLKQEERQRILGVIPNFTTTNIQDAAPLTPRQKFHLAFKSASDPFQLFAAGLAAGVNQAENEFPGYGQGAEGYFKRVGASYADSADGVLWGTAIYPILLHEDPRYFRRGSGSFKSRFLYSVSTTVVTKNDNGTWGPNYANILGNLTAGGISNLYYPSSDRGFGLTMQGAVTVTAEGALGSLFVEFWPDISRKLFHKKEKK